MLLKSSNTNESLGHMPPLWSQNLARRLLFTYLKMSHFFYVGVVKQNSGSVNFQTYHKMISIIKVWTSVNGWSFLLYIRCLMGSTNQADPSCFFFRISWILMEGHFFFVPSVFCRASEASNIDCFKIQVWKFWTKNLNFSVKNGKLGALTFQECEFFDH